MLTKTKFFILALSAVALEGCVQTVEDDYGFSLASCDSRLNRPVLTASANGSYSAAPVNTQTMECAGTQRTFEIIRERGE